MLQKDKKVVVIVGYCNNILWNSIINLVNIVNSNHEVRRKKGIVE